MTENNTRIRLALGFKAATSPEGRFEPKLLCSFPQVAGNLPQYIRAAFSVNRMLNFSFLAKFFFFLTSVSSGLRADSLLCEQT